MFSRISLKLGFHLVKSVSFSKIIAFPFSFLDCVTLGLSFCASQGTVCSPSGGHRIEKAGWYILQFSERCGKCNSICSNKLQRNQLVIFSL